MGGSPFAAIGYAVTYDSIKSYQATHGLESLSYEPFLDHLQSLLRMPIYLASMADDEEIDHIICFFASEGDPYYDCGDMMNVPVPQVFAEVIPASFQTIGGIRRIFVPEGTLYTGDDDGEAKHFMDSIRPSALPQVPSKKDTSEIQEIPQPSTVSFCQMPTEIILNIVEHLLLSIPPSLLRHRQDCAFTFSHINSRLRMIALSAPTIWTSVFVNHERATWEMAKLCYRRSDPCNLHVEIKIRRSTISFPDILGPLFAVAPRLRTLAMSPNPDTEATFTMALKHLVAPNLQELVLTANSEWHWHVPKLPHVTGLTRFKSQGLKLPSTLPYPELTTLEFTSAGRTYEDRLMSMNGLVRILRSCPKLQTLVLGSDLHGMSIPEPAKWVHVQLPDLQELSMRNAPISFIVFALTKIKAPGLRELAIGCSAGRIKVVSSQWEESMPVLSQAYKLRLDQLGVPGTGQSVRDSFEGFLSIIVDRLPNTTCLKIHECEVLKILMSGVKHIGSGGGQLRHLARLEITWGSRSGEVDDVKPLSDFLAARKEHGYPRLRCLSIGASSSAVRTEKLLVPEAELLVQSLSDKVDRIEIMGL